MQIDNLPVLVQQNKQVAVVGLPGVFAGVLDGFGIAVPHGYQGGQQVCLATQRQLLLPMHNLKSQYGFAGVLLDLLFCPSLSVVAHNEESGAGKPGGEQYEGKKKFGPKLQISLAPYAIAEIQRKIV